VTAGDLRIVDISNPSSPVIVGFIDTLSSADDVSVNYPYAYVVGQNDGLHIIDISNPKTPIEIGSESISWPTTVVVKDSYAYVSKYWGGFDIVDISDPSSPQTVGAGSQSERYSFDLYIDGSYVYIVNSEGIGLRVFDVSDPVNPVAVGSYNTLNDSVAVEVRGSNIYIADRYDFGFSRDGGFRILDIY